jgi:hypothetical protein
MTPLPHIPSPHSRPRTLRGRTLAVASAAALMFGLAPALLTPAWAQDDDRAPAWRRIADRIAVNSLDEEENSDELFDGEAPEAMDGEGEEFGSPGDGEQPVEDDTPEGAATDLTEIEGIEITEEGVIVTIEEPDPASMGRPLSVAERGTIGVATGGGRRGQVQINLGKESQDTGVLTNLFEDPNVLRLLGDEPRFVYRAVNMPDPMLFPPVRNAAIYAELTLEAQNLIERGQLEEAQERYVRILELDDRRYNLEMRNKIEQLNRRIGRERVAIQGNVEPEVRLPPWVRQNSRGILYEENDPMALVGDFVLRVGDVVPSFPDVKIESISKHSIRYNVAGRRSFNVEVKGLPE